MRAIVVIATLYLVSPAFAWNPTGHRIVAAIAYQRLTPRARQRVEALLKRHPDYSTTPARAAFIAAASWPDEIKNDPRFYDDLHRGAEPTPLLPGFPDMARHTNWHYYDTPYTPDGAPSLKPASPNALEILERLTRDNLTPYDLPWLEHLVGDVHQPLHCITRILKSQRKGDAGGNFVYVSPGHNLHELWDTLAGSEITDTFVTKLAASIAAEHPAPQRLDHTPKEWIDEGFAVAQKEVYTFGLVTGSRQRPIRLSQAYLENATSVARERIALAGYRLAALLSSKYK
jgi:hypothetical protein